jgi:hypothetical protein
VDRKHRAEMWLAFGLPAFALLFYIASMLMRWLRTLMP